MKKKMFVFATALVIVLSSCSSYFSVDEMKKNYERRAHSTTIVGKFLKTDEREAGVYNNVSVI